MLPVEKLEAMIEASDDDGLRDLLQRAIVVAPPEAIKELAQTLVTIRRRDYRTEAEKN